MNTRRGELNFSCTRLRESFSGARFTFADPQWLDYHHGTGHGHDAATTASAGNGAFGQA